MIRVRFAPSPTGYLHIGSARTALFNWLFARHEKGKFIIRIEDTDKERSKKEFLDEILESLKWLGLNWDEGPYFQSERFEIYKKYADRLLKEEKAYLTTENKGVQTEKPAVKFKMPHERLTINDLVHGPIEINTEESGDQVIIKSDGTPTYNFACVVDDADMGITHVIRGDDHISNTPKQIMLYKALGEKPPEFVHIPLILGTDRSRMSKRHGATSIMEYKQMGILPDCLFNFLSLLGFSLGADREMASRDEIVKEFELSRINKTAAIFDMEKLKWMNGQYMKNKPTDLLMDELVPILKEKGILKEGFDKGYLNKIIDLIKIRAKAMEDLVVEAAPFLKEDVEMNKEAFDKILKKEGAKERLVEVLGEVSKLAAFDEKALEDCIRQLASQKNIKAAEYIHAARVALSGRSVGPGLFEFMAVLGKERCVSRIKKAIDEI